MSRENVELVRRALTAFEEDMTDEELGRQVPDLFDPSVEYDPRETPGRFFGHEGIIQALREFFEVMELSRFTVEQVVDAGNEVAVEAVVSSRGRASDVPVTGRFWMVFTVRDAKIVRLREYWERSEAFEAAGLGE